MLPACSGKFYFGVMREELLHFIWSGKRLPVIGLKTTCGSSLQILDYGELNHYSGPDFLNATIRLNDDVWHGSVEMHLKTTDWFHHGHNRDLRYGNVILHVVWIHNEEADSKRRLSLPTLELRKYVSDGAIEAYLENLSYSTQRGINCSRHLASVNKKLWADWLEELFIRRLRKKWQLISRLLAETKNDWEKVLFALLMKSSGLNINGQYFLDLAMRLDFSLIRKLQHSTFHLESLLLGQSGLLVNHDPTDSYAQVLLKEYEFLSRKYSLQKVETDRPEFMRLRPSNFPTIRLAQLASLYTTQGNLFRELLESAGLKELYKTLNARASSYWDTHFNFGKRSSFEVKKYSKTFKNLLIINAVIPIRYAYHKNRGRDTIQDAANMVRKMPPEQNAHIQQFLNLGIKITSALESQALLQLHRNYCLKNSCLQCAVGISLLK